MIHIILHTTEGKVERDVPVNSNLVVLAGIKKFPELKYGCGMGRCTRCASRVVDGGEHLPVPNWKEERLLGSDKLQEGYRLMCQVYVTHNLEIVQESRPLPPSWKRAVQQET